MRIDGKTHARKAVSLKVGFVSAVQDPAHEGAKSLVLKTREKKPMQTAEQVLKSAFTAALAARKLETDLDSMFETTWTLRRALRESAEAIAKDDSITDKQSALMDSVNEYLDAQKQLAEQIIKPSEPVIMTPEQAEYYNTLDDVNKSAFIDMQDDARDALVSVAKSKDESLVVDGETILKSKVGESVFKQLKNMQAEINKSKEAEKVAKAKSIADENLKHLPGEVSEKTAVVLALQSLPTEQYEAAMKMLKVGDSSLESRFEPAAPVQKKAGKTFDELVTDYMTKHPKLSKSQAIQQVLGTKEGIEAKQAEDDK